MDDPTKDTIPRSAVEYCLRKESVSTNPEKYKTHEKFIDYMNDPEISDFGRWQHSNGFNTALVAVKCDLDKVPSVTPKQRWIPCESKQPEPGGYYLVTKITFGWNCTAYREIDIARYDSDGWHKADAVVAWMPLPKPWEGGQEWVNR